MKSRVAYLVFLSVFGVAVVALGYDYYVSDPPIGQAGPNGSPPGTKAHISGVEGSAPPFPTGGFVIPAASQGWEIDLTATRAIDWDEHRWGQTCDPHQACVQDTLISTWPRWRLTHPNDQGAVSKAQFVKRYPDDPNAVEKGTWVRLRLPTTPDEEPEGIVVNLHEQDVPAIVADQSGVVDYGLVQDSVYVRVLELVTMYIHNNQETVSFKPSGSYPAGPNARIQLKLFWMTPFGADFTWKSRNTVDASGNVVDDNKTGPAEFDANHIAQWGEGSGPNQQAYGTRLKTEITATVHFLEQGGTTPYNIPAGILSDMKQSERWYFIQHTRAQFRSLGSNPTAWCDADWIPEEGTPWNYQSDETLVAADFPPGITDAWLYFADTPGMSRRYSNYGQVGDSDEMWMMLKTGVQFADSSGNMYDVVNEDSNIWRCHCKLTKASYNSWHIDVPANSVDDFQLPVK